MPIDPVFLEVSWRVPNLFLWPVGFIIVGWAFFAGYLAFTGSQSAGQPEIHFPERSAEPEPAEGGEATEESEES